ncbi:WxL domain-containing protein [Lactiplantibacillus pentosus]|uniref:WxL domain-containing protein n=1 Tax=Lactiplantibacillus pentosus TaxID=1589 RepID=UPI0039F4C80D
MKSMLGHLLMAGTLLVAGSMPIVANAAENRSGSTNLQAEFTKSTSTVTPVDPTDPNTPSTGGDDNNGATPGGDLSLIYVSKSLGYGTHEIDVLNDQQYTPDLTSANTNLWKGNMVVEVSDVRGTNAGWKLTVTGSNLTGVDGTTAKGATLSLPKGDVSNSGTDANGAVATTSEVALNGTVGSSAVLNAAKGGGAGVTISQLNPSNLTLNIKANTVKAQTYSGNLNWTLSDLPAE